MYKASHSELTWFVCTQTGERDASLAVWSILDRDSPLLCDLMPTLDYRLRDYQVWDDVMQNLRDEKTDEII